MGNKLDSCVNKVKSNSGKKVNPYAVCSASTGIKKKKGGGYTKGNK
jgi:hypothetical protein